MLSGGESGCSLGLIWYHVSLHNLTERTYLGLRPTDIPRDADQLMLPTSMTPFTAIRCRVSFQTRLFSTPTERIDIGAIGSVWPLRLFLTKPCGCLRRSGGTDRATPDAVISDITSWTIWKEYAQYLGAATSVRRLTEILHLSGYTNSMGLVSGTLTTYPNAHPHLALKKTHAICKSSW